MSNRRDGSNSSDGTGVPPVALSSEAFTLVEMIVVIIIVGILAAVTLPRVVGIRSRQADAEARTVQALVTMAGDKATTMNVPMAIDYADGTLSLYTFRDSGEANTDVSVVGKGKWRPDPLSEPVKLTRLTLDEARQDGANVGSSTKPWRITLNPGEVRPALELALRDADDRRFSIRLESDENVAMLTLPGSTPPPASSRRVDLDDAGRGTTPW